MKLRLFGISALLILITQLSLAQNSEPVDPAMRLLGELTPIRENFDVKFYNLDIEVDIDNQSISGSNTITFVPKTDINQMQIDLYDNMDVQSITQGGKDLKYNREYHSIFIDLAKPVKQGSKDSIKVTYSGKPLVAKNPPWDGGFVWEKDSLGNPWIGVACEGTGASLWWPNKDHLSDEPDDGVQIAITVPNPLKAVSNGRMIGKKDLPGDKTKYIWRTVYSIDNYNVTLYIGDYVNYTSYHEGIDAQVTDKGLLTPSRSKNLDVDYYILSYHVDEAKKHFQFVDDVLDTFEYVFGPYPFYRDGFGVVETSYLGMEHQGAIAYGNQFKMGWRGELVKPYIEFDYLFVHETGHEWWGNNISVQDRADMWIQEGFTTYADAIYVVSMYGYKAYLEYMDYYRKQVKNEVPVHGVYGENKMTSQDVYYKAALMLHTLSQLVENNDEWLATLRKAQQVFKAPYTITDQEMRDFLEVELDMELSAFFEQYLDTTMVPTLQWKRVEDKGDHYVIYRWVNVVDGFDMPVQLTYNRLDQKWIYPTQEWKKVKLPKDFDLSELKVDTQLFYINVQTAD